MGCMDLPEGLYNVTNGVVTPFLFVRQHAKMVSELTTGALHERQYVISASSNIDLSVAYLNDSNETMMQGPPTFNEVSLTKAVVFGVMFVISLIGNTATLIQMFRLRKRKSTINTLIVNLAIADLLVTFFCIAGEAVWAATVQWLAGNIMCKVVKYMQVYALYLSTYITVTIGLDRCVAILDPMRRQGAAQRVRWMMVLAWSFSALFSIPQAIVFHVLQGPFKEEFYQCVTFGSYPEEWQRQLYSVASLLLMFVIPLVIIGTAYGLIFTTISRKSREVSVLDSMHPLNRRRVWLTLVHHYREICLCGKSCDAALSREESIVSTCSGDNRNGNGRGPVRSNLLRRAKRKSLRMSVVIVFAFIVCWTPYYIIFICVTFLGWEEGGIDPRTLLWFSFIGLSNSMLNPIIYGAFQLCKVHKPRSWRRGEWPGSSLKLLATRGAPVTVGHQHPDTRVNHIASLGPSSSSRGRLMPLCRCDACFRERRHQNLTSSPSRESWLRVGVGRQHCTRLTHKHLLSGEAGRCCFFHSC